MAKWPYASVVQGQFPPPHHPPKPHGPLVVAAAVFGGVVLVAIAVRVLDGPPSARSSGTKRSSDADESPSAELGVGATPPPSAAPVTSFGGIATPTRVVGPAAYGADWPLTASSGTLRCIPIEQRGGRGQEIAYVEVDGRGYALNGTAGACVDRPSECAGLKLEKIDALRVDDPTVGKGAKKSLEPLIDAARALCADMRKRAAQ